MAVNADDGALIQAKQQWIARRRRRMPNGLSGFGRLRDLNQRLAADSVRVQQAELDHEQAARAAGTCRDSVGATTHFAYSRKRCCGASPTKLMFVQCAACGAVVGAMDFFNIGSLLGKQAEALKRIGSVLNVEVQVDP